MKKKFFIITVVILSMLSFNKLNAQFILTAMVDSIPTDTTRLCINEWLDLNSTGSANFLMNNNFNNQSLGVGWSSTAANPVFNNPCQCPFVGGSPPTTCNNGVPGQLGPNGYFAWVGTTASNERTLITQSYDLNTYQAIGGCKIKWWMMYGITSEAGSCEDPDEPDEGVHLQYSTNNGATWTDFPGGPNVYPTGNLSPTPPFNTSIMGSGGYWTPKSNTSDQILNTAYFWNLYQNNIPSIAYTGNTKFRWAQLATSSTGYDAWGIDEVEISCPTAPFVQWECPELPAWNYSDFNPPALQLTQAGTYHFIVMLVDLNTGVSVSDTIVAIVNNPIIDINSGLSSVSICKGDSITLYANGNSLTNHNWNTIPIINNDTAIVSPGVTTSYLVSAQDSIGCIAHDSILVTVNPLPVITIINDIVCIGDTAYLAATGGVSFLWSPGGETSASIAVAPTTTTTYQVKITTQFGCSDTSSAIAVINPKPTIQLTDNTSICKGDNATLTASGGIIYLWSTGENTPSIIVGPTTLTSYTVLVTDANGCSDSKSTDVNVIAVPVPLISQDVDTICKGTSTTLTASGGSNYLWNTGDRTASILILPFLTSAYTVTVSNTINNTTCSATASTFMNVKNCNMIFIPNSFSPFGYNTIFKPIGDIKLAKNYSFQVFNKWGQLIFETNNPEQGWDGKLNGEFVISGAYIYYIKFDNIGEIYEKIGTVTVLF